MPPPTDKTIAIVQSSYIPWKGYFDMMARADAFVLLDTVQFTKRDWRSRNRIKMSEGLAWLTVPVKVRGSFEQKIRDVRVADPDWAGRHWQTLRHAYRRAAGFESVGDTVERWYGEVAGLERLSDINRYFLDAIAGFLKIGTPLRSAEEFPDHDDPTARLLGICRAAGASAYLTGPAARDYLDEAAFTAAGVALEYMDYTGYPEHRQLHGDFCHQVTVLDLIFNEGDDARRFLTSGKTP